MRPRVYITQPVSASAVARLRAVAEVTMNPDMLHIATKDELIAAARSHDILFCLLHDRIDHDVIAANPKLKAIASTTITPADIDTAEATRRGIPVTVIPSLLLDDATADLAWALLFAVGRRVAEADRLARVDYLSIHVNLGPKTRHLLGAREFALMKPSAYVINTARGPLIDEDALIAALQARRIAGAGLDVFEHEPGIHPVLLGLPNVVVTAHMGSAVDSLREAMASVAVDNIIEIINGRPAPNCWNPEIYSRKA